MTERILVVGGSGFIGSATLRALAAGPRPRRPELRSLARSAPTAARVVPHVEYLEGDLTEPSTLRGVCDGVRTVLHCASYIGADEERCQTVNVDGTRALLDEARRAGVGRTVLVSTTAVYGIGPHRGVAEHDVVPAPASATSRTRLLAEREVLDAGGTVLRPPLIYGPGDVWVVPALAELLNRVKALPEGGRSRLSLVSVDDLARLLACVARSVPTGLAGTVHHAAHPVPLTLRRLVAILGETLGLPVPSAGVPRAEYLESVARTPGTVTPRQALLLSEDHWYRSPLWSHAACLPGPGHIARLRAAAPWYRRLLAGNAAIGDRAA